MIGNITKGRGFRGALDYVLGKDQGELIGGSMIGITPRELATEFSIAYELNDKVERPVYHASLSLPLSQRLSDEQWNEISVQYLEQMGFTDNQYIVVRHNDTDHDHIHLVASRVRLDGSCVHDSWDYQRSQKALRELELQHNLEPVESSWEVERRPLTKGQYEQRRRELENGIEPEPSIKQQIIESVDSALADCTCTTVEQLCAQLEQMGVETRLRKQRDGSINGISYQYQGLSVTGYNLGQGYTMAALRDRTERNHTKQQEVEAVAAAQEVQAQIAAQQLAQRLEIERQQQLEQQMFEAALRSGLEAEARQVKASETLKLKRMVDAYFQAAPPNCSDSCLTAAEQHYSKRLVKLMEAKQEYEKLEQQISSANKLQKLLPEYQRQIKQRSESRNQWQSCYTETESVASQQLELKQTRQRYIEWSQSPSTVEMCRQRDYLETPPSQQLIVEALSMERQQELERIQELERRRQIDATLLQLQQWYKTANAINRSADYLEQIVEITQEWKSGIPLPEIALEAMSADLKKQQRQEEAIKQEKQRVERDLDWSL